MAEKLTETRIAGAKVPPGKAQAFLWDTVVRGLGVRILSTGLRTFWFMYRPAGGPSVNSRMGKIGPWHPRGLNGARRRAKAPAGPVAGRKSPAAQKQEQPPPPESTARPVRR